MPKPKIKPLLPLSALARRLDLPYPLAARLADDGVLNPDSTAGRIRLFREDRISTLRDALIRKGVIQ